MAPPPSVHPLPPDDRARAGDRRQRAAARTHGPDARAPSHDLQELRTRGRSDPDAEDRDPTCRTRLRSRGGHEARRARTPPVRRHALGLNRYFLLSLTKWSASVAPPMSATTTLPMCDAPLLYLCFPLTWKPPPEAVATVPALRFPSPQSITAWKSEGRPFGSASLKVATTPLKRSSLFVRIVGPASGSP